MVRDLEVFKNNFIIFFLYENTLKLYSHFIKKNPSTSLANYFTNLIESCEKGKRNIIT